MHGQVVWRRTFRNSNQTIGRSGCAIEYRSRRALSRTRVCGEPSVPTKALTEFGQIDDERCLMRGMKIRPAQCELESVSPLLPLLLDGAALLKVSLSQASTNIAANRMSERWVSYETDCCCITSAGRRHHHHTTSRSRRMMLAGEREEIELIWRAIGMGKK